MKKNIPWDCHGMSDIPGGDGIIYGPGHTKYRDYQGILAISARPFSPAAPKFRNFCKISRKNNREFDFIEQGFHPITSGNFPAPPPPRYMSPFIANYIANPSPYISDIFIIWESLGTIDS